jgi:4-azaleucine resistance transporter AzlC
MNGPSPSEPPDKAPPRTRRESFSAGWRAALPFALAGGVLSISFGVLAREAGMPIVAAIAMSAIVFAGSAQFAAISILASGGTLGAAVGAAALMNSRFLPMGIALAPSLPGGPLKRALQGQPVVDTSWAMAARGDGSFDRWHLFGASAIQYVTWVGGTVLGALAGDVLGEAHTLGLDAIFPAFFLALLIVELKDGRARGVAALGALIALALVSFTPPGIPVLVASLAALVGVRRSGSAER